MAEPASINVDALRAFGRQAARLNEQELLGALRNVFTAAERVAIAQMQARAAATGSRQAVRVAGSLRGTKLRDRAVVRSAALPFAAGAAWGAHHDQPRRGPSGRQFVGYNQFPLPLSSSSWFWRGGTDAVDQIEPQVREAVETLIEKLF